MSCRRMILGLGSNLGDRAAHLRDAVEAMRAWPEVERVELSDCYESAYLGPRTPQPDYLNLCAALHTELRAEEVLERTQALERRAGRDASTHMMARTLDIDILLDGGRRIDTATLTLPHPRLRVRRFVLQPLVDLDPGLRLPGDGAAVVELLQTPEIAGQTLRKFAFRFEAHAS